MNLYAETSAVVGWLLGEQLGSSVRRALQRAQSVFSSDLTLIEGDRALHRAAATGRISPDEARRARTLLASGADLGRFTSSRRASWNSPAARFRAS